MDEAIIKRELSIKRLEPMSSKLHGGCISKARSYHTDKYGDVFIKYNNDEKAREMFDGEFASLDAISLTKTIHVPKPIKSIYEAGRACLVTEYISMTGPAKPLQLGTDLAKLHLHNIDRVSTSGQSGSFVGAAEKDPPPIKQFGFPITTYSGYMPLVNEWTDDWVEFYARYRLKSVIDAVVEKYGDRQILSLWPALERKIPSYFAGCHIVPSLLHGDLWSGNYSYDQNGPVVFDPASFYGHSEYEMGILTMFGGFDDEFFTAYHSLIPKANGFSHRVFLYQLFHHLNHWYHFGDSYKMGSITLMQLLS
ncbi:Ketosamine-3-kinase [Toxocara canis]|uniref:protein-ribulosamine 3-kinase n=1 Tax=Toxocara canis TaxID=6265 RepID=A0A0B2V2M6_TOXCA|nr:Ketosamine-3-kinase [Toxocara canis]